jgi:NAD(P)-dependent dehydrogenase (short-subunit alcohol dehydrogenase family)
MNPTSQDPFRLDGKVAIVTGAARGLGAATASILSQRGARVAAVDLHWGDAGGHQESIGRISDNCEIEGISPGGMGVPPVAALAFDARPSLQTGETPVPPGFALFGHAPGNITTFCGDVSQVAGMQALVAEIAEGFGRIDILVNNAAICPRLPFYESTEADWEKLMSVNAKGQYFLCQAVCRVMKAQGGGRIINIASTGGRVGSVSNASIYSGTKGAIVMFSKSIAREVAADGILVNCVAPGTMDTDLMRNLSPEQLKAITDQVPLKRLGHPEEVARLVAFMASDAFGYATGATYDINGGWVML